MGSGAGLDGGNEVWGCALYILASGVQAVELLSWRWCWCWCWRWAAVREGTTAASLAAARRSEGSISKPTPAEIAGILLSINRVVLLIVLCNTLLLLRELATLGLTDGGAGP